MPDFFMVPVRKMEIEVGKPLPYTVYDAEHNLLLSQGSVVSSERQVEVLLSKGVFREKARARPQHGLDFPDYPDPLVADPPSSPKPAAARPAPPIQPDKSHAEGDGHAGQHARGVQATLDEAKLTPGDALQLQQLLDGQTERFTVRVIGMMKPKSVLVTAPTLDDKLIFVRDGQPFLIRAFSGLNVCAFKSKVLKAHHSPFPYLHLAYPDSVELMRIRKSIRARVSIIIAISDKEGGRQLAAARIVDLSVGGARAFSANKFGEKGQQVFVSFKVKLDDIEEYINVPATLRSFTEEFDEDGKGVYAIGMQFEELPPHERLLIMNLVYQYLLKENE